MSPGLAPATPAARDDAEPDDEHHGASPAENEPLASGRMPDGDLDPIPLPDVRWNERSRRRRTELRRRRRRRLRRGAVLLAVAAALTGLTALVAAPAGRLLSRDDASSGAGERDGSGAGAAQGTGPQPLPPVPPVLVAHQDGAGRASSLTLLVPAAGRKGGTVVLLPPGTMAEVVSLGLEPVRQSLEVGGPSRLEATVENLLGAPLGGVVVLDDAGLTSLVAPAGPMTVNVPERVERVSPNGRVEVLYEAGTATLAPPSAGRFLSAKGRESDLARLTRHQAFWEAWLARLRDRAIPASSRSPELNAAVGVLAAGPVETRLVPVEAFGTAADGGELYKVRDDELSRLVAGVFPTSAGQGMSGRPRVQVLNGTGALEVADAVRNKLGAGFDVRLTGNAPNFDYERTEIVYYDRDQEAVADRLRQALGVGALVLSRRPLDVVDVTVIVGKDFRP